jgi:hypothetical protein
MGVQVDRFKNERALGKKRTTAKESLYFGVDGSGGNVYEATLNYDTGHFCQCRGMLSKIRKFGAVSVLDPRNAQHWCKHVNQVRSPAAFELRIEARKIRNEAFGIHENPQDPETGRVIEDVPAQVSNRRKAVAHTQAKHGNVDAATRLAEIEAEREAILKEISDAQAGVNTVVASLVSEHGAEAIKAALKAAS